MLTLNSDGTATLNLNGQEVTLKMPSLREYGDLMDVLDESRFKTLELSKEAMAERVKINDEGAEAFRRAKIKERAADEIRSEFITAAIHSLGGVEVEKDTLPRWVSSNDLITKLTNHWDTVPFPGSAPAM